MTDFLYNYTCLWHLVLIATFIKAFNVLIVFLSELLKLIGELFIKYKNKLNRKKFNFYTLKLNLSPLKKVLDWLFAILFFCFY